MAKPVRRRLRKFLPWALGLFGGGIALAFIIAYSGIYNIAASAGHPAWLEWFLQLGKERSVIFNSRSVDPPKLDIAELVPLGAAHFQGTCATCHGVPGQPVNPVFEHMLPSPPDLQKHAPHWTREQLFWIARHGIQFTGMPAWSGKDRDDEVWAVAAFLEALPSMTKADYHRHASGNSETQGYSAKQFISEGRPRLDLTACSRCHDTADAPPTSLHIPRLGGQGEAYLIRALQDYRDDSRQSGFMEPVADDLDDEQIERLAAYYASLTPFPHKRARPSSPEARELGRQLAEQGDRERKIPACLSCHGVKRRTDYPRLAGQSEQYIKQQLQILRRGGRDQTPHGAMMSVVAKRLTEQQVEAAASFFASQPPQAEHSRLDKWGAASQP
ncbi:Cytochrome c553 [Candidatus Methylobacter favarea]|uniref:Cytochrome c553 n=1 Tax=Candidatus Methylobacter favarea TaxID=2707345 RepID=A0A8S0YAA8_9GAMM|nr:c-type cytochrome [Candidatus Methylobacter favarea]CAA9891465.1 Cytochrome c553 [Candidatus Methylobacter favarea]